MKAQYVKSTLSLAIATALASQTAIAFDGYAYSGQTARSQALQLDYFTHSDVGNIWVNPALVGQYQDQVLINVNNNNNDGDGSGGLLLGLNQHTIGLYIGRDSVSTFGEALDLVAFDNQTGAANTDLQNTFDQRNPENQFDFFYGFNAGDLAFGARLNYQDNQQSLRPDAYTSATLNGSAEFDSLDSALEHFRSNVEAPFANDPEAPTDTDLIYTGSAEVDTLDQGRARLTAREINLSLGFEARNIGLDGAVLIGSATGRHSVPETYQFTDYTLGIDIEDNQFIRETLNDELRIHDQLELDKGETFGIALRQRLAETYRSSWHASLAYVTQDYTADFSGATHYDSTFWMDDADNELAGSEEGRFSNSGLLTYETELVRVMTSYQLRPTEATAITIAGGFERLEADRELHYRVDEDLQVVTAELEGMFGLEAGQFETTYGDAVGTQAHDELTRRRTSIPLTIALEQRLGENWTGRASVSRELYRETEVTEVAYYFDEAQAPDAIDAPEADAEDQSAQAGPARTVVTNRERMGDRESWVQQPTNVQFGVGYTRDNLTIDAFLGKEFFTQGTDNTLFSAVTVSYRF